MANEETLGGIPTTIVNFTKEATEEDTKKAFADWARPMNR